jgi:uncharacterized protein YndB with AHSA1/START domain
MSEHPNPGRRNDGTGRREDATIPSLTLKRRIKASPATLFRAWTNEEALSRWFTPGGSRLVKAELDVRIGGRFFIKSIGANGEDNGVGGEYLEVVPDRKLVFSWAWQSTPARVSQVTLTFKPDGNETILTLLHEKFFDETALAGHTRGWNETLDRLVQLYGGREA